VREAEPDQEDCCDEVTGNSRNDPGRDGRPGQCVVETGVRAQRQVPPAAVTVNRGSEADQQDAEGDADGACHVTEAQGEWGHDEQRRGRHLESGVHVERDCPEQSHREYQGTNVCAIRV
jgi:hypothetical protein